MKDYKPSVQGNNPRAAQNTESLEDPVSKSVTPAGQNVAENQGFQIKSPQITLPKGGGAIRGIDEKFSVNAVNGTSSVNIPLGFSASRQDFAPEVALNYNSGSGNGAFGLGWQLSLSSISRRTDKGLPKYQDEVDSDTYVITDSEDLVPYKIKTNTGWKVVEDLITENGVQFQVKRYRSRIESEFNRIERWKNLSNNHIHWKVRGKENVTHVYGPDDSSCISDPSDQKKIFKWLLERSYDDRGNCIVYKYKKENLFNVPDKINEQRRKLEASFTNLYLEKIWYGAKTPYDPSTGVLPEFMFQSVLDYNLPEPVLNALNQNFIDHLNDQWSFRDDAFSFYRSCFEIRHYRLCHRILHFHHFDELGQEPYLVRSITFGYQFDAASGFNFLNEVINKGYKKNQAGYSSKELPPFSFSYEKAGWDTTVKSITPENLVNAPLGIDDDNYLWVDLFNEGISGILSEQAGHLYYKSNLGDGNFTPALSVAERPSFRGFKNKDVSLQELEGDGRKFLVSNTVDKGFFELTEDQEWLPFQNFKSIPTVNFKNPNVKFIDLDGDGRADILVDEDNVFCWFASKGVAGYDDYRLITKDLDENKGPNLLFTDNSQAILIADINGDGLSDLVRVRNGEIVYWPNLGYGNFGSKVVMQNAPYLDLQERFSPKNIRLADINGSGTVDLLYLGNDSIKTFINFNGNEWGNENIIFPFPQMDNTSSISVIDILGNGTSSIVWSSPLPSNLGSNIRYIDLMGGRKPFVMKSYENNLGKRVTLEYKPSTFYYLQDKKAGKPWITKLPFPVQCVAKVITEDLEYVEGVEKPRLRFTQSYTYHHGYFDYTEKEFRGFGRVEQLDTEEFDHFKLSNAQNVVEQDLTQPPIKIISWYHTGAYFNKEKILSQFAEEYFKSPQEFELEEVHLNDDLNAEEYRQAVRACKGLKLREEIYALDGSPKETFPYTVTTRNCLVKRLQPKEDDQYAVFLVHESEAVEYHYERNIADPRIAHNLNLEVDEFGNILKSASVVYGRKISNNTLPQDVQDEQAKMHVLFSTYEYTNFFDQLTPRAIYRLPLTAQSSTYELTGPLVAMGEHFTIQKMEDKINQAMLIPYETIADGTLQKRLIEEAKSLYLNDDLTTPLDFKKMDTLGIVYEHYKLAFTSGLKNILYQGKVTDLMMSDAKYIRFAGNNNWWIPSGVSMYLRSGDSLAEAKKRFFQPVSVKDPFGDETKLKYDAYQYIVVETEDPLLNVMKVLQMDYRTLLPSSVQDINDNVTESLTDELSMVVVTSVYGSETSGVKGDDKLVNYVLQQANQVDDVFQDPLKYLQGATSYFYYDLFAFKNRQQPICFATVQRETHKSELQQGQNTKVQLSLGYTNGLGSEMQTKVQAEPGKAFQWKNGQKIEVETGVNLRWVTTGRTIFNNKGKVVKQYEPFFSSDYHYESEKELVEIGYPATIYYDPLGRAIKKINPEGTINKVEFDIWEQKSFDENDSVLESQWYVNAGSPDPLLPEPADPVKRAAWLAAQHANTPLQSHLDSLGRIVYILADNSTKGKYQTRIILDVEGNEKQVKDALGNIAAEYSHDMLGNVVVHKGMDSGTRLLFNDSLKRILFQWDNKNHRLRTEYDVLSRPTKHWIIEDVLNNSPEKLINLTIYGENQSNDKIRNLRGKVYQTYDQSGKSETPEYDFRGNVKSTNKVLAKDYKQVVNWDTPNPAALLENEVFSSSSKADALNRPLEMVFPDNSKASFFYNEAMFLQKLEVYLSRQNQVKEFIKDIDYNAKGQRVKVIYGNNTASRFSYDERTHRVTQILTTRNAGIDILQNLNYYYDSVGNITEVRDLSQQTLFFNNAMVDASTRFEYDAIYRLKKGYGREHSGQNAPVDQFDFDKTKAINGNRLTLKGDMNAMQRYEQAYEYDDVGNLLKMIHSAGTGALQNRWTRFFEYNNDDVQRANNGVNAASPKNNQLLNEWVGARPLGNLPKYQYDEHGNMLNLQKGGFNLIWDFADHLKTVDLGGGGKAYYVYDASGQRVRKVIEKGNLVEERIYLGSLEKLRQRLNNNQSLERETLHIMDNKQRIALVESRILGNDPGLKDLIRYQYSNNIGTATLEVDGDPANPEIITYEEYYPFGSTAYQATRNQTETPKRYRYTGKERDEETGLNYHGARYYAPWLVRWTAPDPLGIKDGVNVYKYVPDPVQGNDTSGNECNYRDKDGNMYDICVEGEPTPNPILMEERRKWEEQQKPKPVVVAKPKPKPEQPKEDPVVSNPPPANEDEGTVGKPGFGESLIPIWGSGRESIYYFQKGQWGWGIVFGALAVSDVFLVKSLVTAGGKLIVKGGILVLGKGVSKEAGELALKQAAEQAAKEAAAKEAAELAAKDAAKKEAAELAAKEAAEKAAAEQAAKEAAAKEAAAQAAKEAAKVGKIAYGSSDLSKVAIEFRKAQKITSARNIAVFEYVEGGVKKTIAMASERGVGHSERLISKELAKRGIDPSKVTRIYSELEPCIAPGGYCKNFISKFFPGVKVTFSFEYGATKASRRAGVEALREAVKAIFK